MEIRPGNGMYFEAPFRLAHMELLAGNEVIARWSAEDAGAEKAVLREGSQWGEIAAIEGEKAIEVKDYGSPFQKVCLQLSARAQPAGEKFSLRLRALGESAVSANITGNAENGAKWFFPALLDLRPQTRYRDVLLAEREKPGETRNIFFGTADVIFENIRIIQKGNDGIICKAGVPFTVILDYIKKNKRLDETLELFFGFHKNGVDEAFRSILQKITLPCEHGQIQVDFPDISLGKGDYTISPMLARNGYFHDRFGAYFSINPHLICCYARYATMTMLSDKIFTANQVVIYKPKYIII
jgi:hypothetical protein